MKSEVQRPEVVVVVELVWKALLVFWFILS